MHHSRSNRGLGSIAIAAASLLAAGCSRDAAAEEPVQLKPGMYEVSLSGGGAMFSSTPSELEKKSCVTADNAEFFPQTFTRRYLEMDDSCSGPLSERKGNQISGKLSCPLVESQVSGEIAMDYVGAVSPEAVTVKVKAKGTLTEADLSDRAKVENLALFQDGVTIKMAVKRVGDC